VGTKSIFQTQNEKQGQNGCGSYTELARLKSLNAEMYEALKQINNNAILNDKLPYSFSVDGRLIDKLAALLDKAEGR
jgi:hypothetical protein